MSLVTIGLKSVGFGDIAVDGGPATVFVTKFNTSVDSFSFTEEAPAKKEVLVEEQDLALYIKRTKGARSIKLNIADMDVATLAYLQGGTVTTATGLKTYSEPDSIVNVEKTVKITPEVGLSFIINRGLLTCVDTGNLGKNNEKLWELTVDVLLPTKTGVPGKTILEVTA